MAASQKKTGGKRTSSGGTRRSGSASGSSRGNSRGSKAPARRPMRREIGAAVCLALALFAALGYFHIQAIFIDFFSGLLKGLLGYGFWLMPPALLLAAYILAFHRGRPVRLRVTCALLLPLLFSCIVHGLLGRVLPWDAALVKTLWAADLRRRAGGRAGPGERPGVQPPGLHHPVRAGLPAGGTGGLPPLPGRGGGLDLRPAPL